MTSSPPLNLKVMLKYLLILLLCLVIYASTRYTTRRGLNTSSRFNIYDTQNPGPVCNSTGSYTYSSCFPSAPDTLKQGGDPVGFGGSLISENGTFKLGFFVRGGNTYLGIWYNNTNHPEEVIVWVANRENPIPHQQQSNCSLVIGGRDGVARLLDSNNHSYWSTGFPPPTSSYYGGTELQLKENGNLILISERGTRSEVLWQSFENPTDTLLEDQWSSFSTSSSSIPNFTSWEGPDNPAPGNFTLQIASSVLEISLSVTRNNATYWASTSPSLPIGLTSLLDGTPTSSNVSQMLVMNSSGSVQLWELQDGIWSISWMAPQDQCDLYETCGSFGVCDPGNGFMCKCLPGFAPHDPVSWESKHFTADQCSKRTIGNANCTTNVFLSLPMIKLPPKSDRNSITQSEQDCKDDCLNDCGCKAYSFNKSGCQLWNTDLSKIKEEFYDPDNRTLVIRVSPSDIDFGKSACGSCGANVIPYPLSTNSTCGDPDYSYFQCNSSNGQVYLRPITGSLYKVSHINEAAMKFVIQLPQQGGGTGTGTSKCDTTNNIESKLVSLNNSSPFSVTNCRVVLLLGRPLVEEVEISWNPPPPPPCLTSSDCDYWPNTTCYQDVKVCKCAEGFHSHLLFLNCTKVDDHKGISLWVKVGVASTCGIVLLLGTIYVIILRLRKRRATWRPGITAIKTDNDVEDIDIPFVDYESILYATDNFSEDNKLGVGGFGPVYKGKLVDGNAVAIKRLSAASTQGAEEFRNEVILIAKLQHRNLVRVLGYCAKENEKILIYEYMPNKSLDAFLFDHTISPLLDWIKRFNIIMGIARGLLYLHQDSRLIIIHRDLKPSNILLDEELNPKISDFGLARIVAGNELAASTARIIGTHGYMSPEYALDGYFSIKSDVYSFGIIILEIISGRRCASLLQYDNNLISLLGYAWFLWDKGDPMELVDESVESYDSSEVKRCINVGLLCVQEDPSDRPTMSNVLLMLSGDNMNLPYPKQPVFVARRPPSETASSSSKFGMSDSNVELTTTLEGR